MPFADEIRKCVAFIGCPIAGGDFRITGSVFFYGTDQGGSTNPTFLVTADHVIRGLRDQGVEWAAVRINTKAGTTKYLKTRVEDWFSHPTDSSLDVAILECGVPNIADHLVFPSHMSATTGQFAELQIEPGTDVLVTGLFSKHAGNARNIPYVRSGTLACISEEKVPLDNYGDADVHMVEVHSTGGLSGSPVIAKVPDNRVTEGVVVGPRYHLIGLMHGHWYGKVHVKAKIEYDDVDVVKLMTTGIAVVVPVERIDELMVLYAQHPRPRSTIDQDFTLEKIAPT